MGSAGGNVAGLSLQATDVAGKRFELFREAVPRLRQLAIMFDAGYPATVREMDGAQNAARTLGLRSDPKRHPESRRTLYPLSMLKSQADALYVALDALRSPHFQTCYRNAANDAMRSDIRTKLLWGFCNDPTDSLRRPWARCPSSAAPLQVFVRSSP